MPYPVTVSVQPLLTNRNKMTVGFRLILAIPHFILVGGIGVLVGGRRDVGTSIGGENGLLGFVAFILAIISWFTIVIGGFHIIAIRQFTTFYMRWRARALAYIMLLEDAYPPFGDAPYPVSLEIGEPPTRDRLTVAFRIILLIPQFIVLFFLLFAWWITSVVAWFAILFTGAYPEGLYTFGVGCLRWLLRVEAYFLLLVDVYPPFSLDCRARQTRPRARWPPPPTRRPSVRPSKYAALMRSASQSSIDENPARRSIRSISAGSKAL